MQLLRKVTADIIKVLRLEIMRKHGTDPKFSMPTQLLQVFSANFKAINLPREVKTMGMALLQFSSKAGESFDVLCRRQLVLGYSLNFALDWVNLNVIKVKHEVCILCDILRRYTGCAYE